MMTMVSVSGISLVSRKYMYTLCSANTGHSPNAVSMLGQRRRRWANIETALGECPVFAGQYTLTWSTITWGQPGFV